MGQDKDGHWLKHRRFHAVCSGITLLEQGGRTTWPSAVPFKLAHSGKLPSNIRKHFLFVRMAAHWHRLSWEVAKSSPLGILQSHLDTVLGNWFQVTTSAKALTRWSPFQSQPLCDPVCHLFYTLGCFGELFKLTLCQNGTRRACRVMSFDQKYRILLQSWIKTLKFWGL